MGIIDKKVIEFKIDQLQELIDDTSDLYTNEWELICLEKIRTFLQEKKITDLKTITSFYVFKEYLKKT